MHTQHVKFCGCVAWGSGVGGVAAVGVVFEEGEVSGLVKEDDDRLSVVEVVVVVVVFLPSPSLLLVSLLVVLLDCIDSIWGVGLVVLLRSVPAMFLRIRMVSRRRFWGDKVFHPS